MKLKMLSETKITNMPTKEMVDFFKKRTKHHIELVKQAINQIIKAYPEYTELEQRAETHDQSKFQEPELIPYIHLTWQKKQEQEGNPTKTDHKKQIQQATQHHVITNKHHPESHVDKSEVTIDPKDRDKLQEPIQTDNMTDLDIAEMIADWQAMSVELKTNTAREWYEKHKDKRWKFTKDQETLIDKLLKVFGV